MSLVSAGCVMWLERLQPFFAFVAVAALACQTHLLIRRPRATRRRGLPIVLATAAINVLVFAAWVVLSLRYQ